ncbi:hypothetical protein FANTH_5805 [Fusarium anthophilum]|uniref:Uncharacterized protein n=1 Tax=Fusarium anthophilum TaxID=48485 RepID=A0A8H5E6A3_9HYPO|nr:hypothetical protein FANTH_5805 [Fusarium anthophilum]
MFRVARIRDLLLQLIPLLEHSVIIRMLYPEGEVFFMRSVLRNNDPAHYRANNLAHFYSHLMVKHIWNVEADHSSKNANSWTGHCRQRSPYTIVTGSSWNTHYGNWKQLPFSYGPRESDIGRRLEHNLCTNDNRFKNHEKGDAAEAWFMTMPMPTKEERWVWIDMVARIRAIYIPVAFSASKNHPNLSMWLQVSFTQNRVADIWSGGSSFLGYETTAASGLGVWRGHSIGFDITGLTELLSCPRQFRKVNPYEAKFIKIAPRDTIRTVSVTDSYSDAYDFSWITIERAHSGLDIEWGKGEKGSWFEDFFKNAVAFGLGVVPGVGPLLSIAFSLGWTAVVNPDRFMYELSLWAPSVKVPELFEEDVRKNSAEIRALTHEFFWNMGSAEAIAEVKKLEAEEQKKKKVSGEVKSYFQRKHEVLRVDEAKYDKKAGADEEPGEVLVEVPPQDGPTNGQVAGDKE